MVAALEKHLGVRLVPNCTELEASARLVIKAMAKTRTTIYFDLRERRTLESTEVIVEVGGDPSEDIVECVRKFQSLVDSD